MQDPENHPMRASLLIVDDEEMLARLLKRGLNLIGFDVEFATGAPEALEMLRTRRFDVLLTDLNMPKMRGDELQKIARRENPDLIVFYITAEVDPDPDAPPPPDIDGFFVKPFQLADVAREVNAALEKRREKRENADGP